MTAKLKNEEHIERMMAASNIRNIDQVYQGFHSLPKPYKSPNGYEIKMWNKNGTITTPWYGERYVDVGEGLLDSSSPRLFLPEVRATLRS